MRKPTLLLSLLLTACGLTTCGSRQTPGAATVPEAGANGIAEMPAVAPNAQNVRPGAADPMETGAIAGSLGYPSEVIPAMRVCAFDLAEGAAHCISSAPFQREYRIDDVPRGDYQVLAYPRDGSSAPGGYTGCVDDLSARCTEHDLRVVVVVAGKTTRDIDPVDFYAGDAGVGWPVEP